MTAVIVVEAATTLALALTLPLGCVIEDSCTGHMVNVFKRRRSELLIGAQAPSVQWATRTLLRVEQSVLAEQQRQTIRP